MYVMLCSGKAKKEPSILKVKKFYKLGAESKTYEIFRPFFNRTSSVNDMNVKKMNFKKGFNASWGLELCHR